MLQFGENQPSYERTLGVSHFTAGRHQHTALLWAKAVNKSHFLSRDSSCVSLNSSLEPIAAESQINQCCVCNTCNYSCTPSTEGGGEANPVNWEPLGWLWYSEAWRVVNLLSHLSSHSEDGARPSSEETGLCGGLIHHADINTTSAHVCTLAPTWVTFSK